MKKITKSRYISINDKFIERFVVNYGFLGLKKLKWDFVKSGWWSRPYEYKTNLELYKNIFVKYSIYFEEEVLDGKLHMDNINSIAPFSKGWTEMNIEKLTCYRLIGYKI